MSAATRGEKGGEKHNARSETDEDTSGVKL